ncbi:hypothetical protein RFI_04691 [Reticulomyxa filosa]|uniref:Uncharacterized protein n=1 Tax=Reticulomyxa filosa TaxID=46433 RepID=X6P1L6_RETFI|nr:hypothetical protein RFI_04691 [Reticulomyxa filosa]|eukprot:ETO32425.1 hypothetical protein RFI_04691 [Reticulomyxa filosa]
MYKMNTKCKPFSYVIKVQAHTNTFEIILFKYPFYNTQITSSTTLQQQLHLMELIKKFDNKISKGIILKNMEKLLKEENELKIKREMCLHILWNILKYPKHIKYRQINKQALYNYLFQKCHQLNVNLKQAFEDMEKQLQYFGFIKENDDNWYYRYNHIQISYLWGLYKYWIYQQITY